MKWKCFLAFLFLLFNVKDTIAQMNAFRESGTIELDWGRNITELFMIDDVLYVLAYDSEYTELPPCIDPCKVFPWYFILPIYPGPIPNTFVIMELAPSVTPLRIPPNNACSFCFETYIKKCRGSYS